jgi:hypothetical protein
MIIILSFCFNYFFFSRKFWTYFRRLLVHRNAFKQIRYRRDHTLHWYSKRPQEDDFM